MTDTLAPLTPPQPHHQPPTEQQDRASFYLTGRHGDTRLGAVDGLGLRPALLTPYRDLAALRHDYPVVLVDTDDPASAVASLSGLVDDMLEQVATGEEADRLRHHALAIEQQIRDTVEAGPAQLSQAWQGAIDALDDPDDEAWADSAVRLAHALPVDGELVACRRHTPSDVVTHIWSVVQGRRMARLGARIDRLRQALRDILDAEQASSPAGLAPERLGHSVGPVFSRELDLDVLSSLLTDNRPAFRLSTPRRDRVTRLLEVLDTQRFVPLPDEEAESSDYGFVYASISDALTAYHDRFQATNELARALVMADLEADGRYREEAHDALFESWSVADIDAETLALFPEYLVRLQAEALGAYDSVELVEALADGLPMKVLVAVDDLLEVSHVAHARSRSGLTARSLGMSVLTNGRAFVLQAPSSLLYRCRDRIVSGSSRTGAALFLVYTGSGAWLDDLPPYLASAAALESRVFPAFVLDPSAGSTWAERFSLEGNPQVEAEWPVHELRCEDGERRERRLQIPFTTADFFASDTRLLRDLALGDGTSQDRTVPYVERLDTECTGCLDALPYVLMTDSHDVVHRVLVDRRLIQVGEQTLERWRSLQELGGVHSSYAARAVEAERARWALERDRAVPDEPAGTEDVAAGPGSRTQDASVPVAVGDQSAAEPEAAAEEAPVRDPDQPWIDTPRCSTCNECTSINETMFRYDDNRQAYIADADAGSYAQLVLAAESCQVSIIHPGKPRDPTEPGLEELISRAAVFN